ncbi:cellulase family glycosylhydrolase [Polaribacter sp.]|nr:cellulase family glycosylhydrolase [Polaribacter sp.]
MFKNKVLLCLVVSLMPFVLFAQISSYEMVKQMGRGLNLGNVLSAPIEGNWSPEVREPYFIDVAAAGFTNVRIPMDFFGARTTGDTSGYSSAAGTAGNYTGTADNYIVSSIYLDRIEQVIEWSLNQGLVTIIDFHGSNLKSEFIYTFDSEETEYTDPTSAKRVADIQKFLAIWAQIANRFKDYSENLLFEVINEPYFHMSKSDMDALNTDVLAVIRGSGGSNGTRNVIITGGTGTSHEAPLQIEPSIISGDTYVIATFHYYQPFDFTSSSADARDNESWGSVQDKELLTTRFDIVSSWATSNNIPIFLGEFSADNTGGYKYSTGDLNTISGNATGFADGGPDNASRVEFHRFVAEQAINRGFSFAAWDSGPKSNKTIHKRTDNSETENFNISAFSVNTYEPKSTNISTVVDTSIWVEDVKDALLSSGTWPLCYGPSPDPIIFNPNFECGYSSGWNLKVLTGSTASISDSGATDAYNGDTAAKIVVETAIGYNKVLLENNVFTNDLNGKNIAIKCFAKSDDATSFRFQIKTIYTSGTTSYFTSPVLNLQEVYSAYEYGFDLSEPTTSVQVKVLCGKQAGTYYFDDFETTITDSESLSIDDDALNTKIVLYPNPSRNFLNVKLSSFDKKIKNIRIIDVNGRIINEYTPEHTSSLKLNTNNLENGVYLIQITTTDNKVLRNKRIVVAKYY